MLFFKIFELHWFLRRIWSLLIIQIIDNLIETMELRYIEHLWHHIGREIAASRFELKLSVDCKADII